MLASCLLSCSRRGFCLIVGVDVGKSSIVLPMLLVVTFVVVFFILSCSGCCRLTRGGNDLWFGVWTESGWLIWRLWLSWFLRNTLSGEVLSAIYYDGSSDLPILNSSMLLLTFLDYLISPDSLISSFSSLTSLIAISLLLSWTYLINCSWVCGKSLKEPRNFCFWALIKLLMNY